MTIRTGTACTRTAVAMPVLLGALLAGGCGLWEQAEIARDEPLILTAGTGVVVGSVTAPQRVNHHETVAYHYRSVAGEPRSGGQVTSATKHKYVSPHPFIPACAQVDIPEACGRLFSVELPVGRYEFYRGELIGRDDFGETPSLTFEVLPGKVSYLGNLHTTYCIGMASRWRGNILGADLQVRDEYDRDRALIRQRFPALRELPIDRQLLPDAKWQWRVSFEPHDWAECSAGPSKTGRASRSLR